MKQLLRTIFRPLLAPLEAGDEPYAYKRSHRIILIIMSGLFAFLASLSFFLAPSIDYLFPVLIFGGAALCGLIVGLVGKDSAVARIWGSRQRNV